MKPRSSSQPYSSLASIDGRSDTGIDKSHNLYITFGSTAISLSNPQNSVRTGVKRKRTATAAPVCCRCRFLSRLFFGLLATSVNRLYVTSLDYCFAPTGNKLPISKSSFVKADEVEWLGKVIKLSYVRC